MAGVEWMRRRMVWDNTARACCCWCCSGRGIWTSFPVWWEASGGFSAEEWQGYLSRLLLERMGLVVDHCFCKVVVKTQQWFTLLYEGEFDNSQPANRCSVSGAINGAIHQKHWFFLLLRPQKQPNSNPQRSHNRLGRHRLLGSWVMVMEQLSKFCTNSFLQAVNPRGFLLLWIFQN